MQFIYAHTITKVLSSISSHGLVYSIQYCMIQFVSDSRWVGGFILMPDFTHHDKIDCHDIDEIYVFLKTNNLNFCFIKKV